MRNTHSDGVSEIEVISIQGDWTIIGKKKEQDGRFVISEVFVKPTKKLPPGGLSATVWRNLKVNDLINKIEKLSKTTDALQKEIITLHESILRVVKLENTQVLLDFVINNWDRRGRQKQPEKVYAYLSALYILFNFLDRRKPLTLLSEQLSLPKRTLLSRINTCYELGYLERGKKYGYTVGKFALRWSPKTSEVLKNENFPFVNFLSKIFAQDIGRRGLSL